MDDLHRHLFTVLMDREWKHGVAAAVDVTLLGRPFRVPEGPFRLSALARAPVFPTFARRSGYFSYEFAIRPRIVLPRSACQADLKSAAQRATDEMASFLKAHPTQWFNFK